MDLPRQLNFMLFITMAIMNFNEMIIAEKIKEKELIVNTI